MSTSQPPAPPDAHPHGFTGWLDERIHVAADNVLSDENITRISMALLPMVEKLLDDKLPALKQALIDTVTGSADRIINDVGDHINESAQHITEDINGVVDNVGQEIRSIPDTITHDIKSLLPPFLGGGD